MHPSITHLIRRALPLAVAITALAAGSASAKAGGPTVTEFDVPFGGPRIRIVETAKPKTKTVLIDWEKDGKWDAGVTDVDGDGVMDFRWVDSPKGDGKPQPGELKRIPKPDPDKICALPPAAGPAAVASTQRRPARRRCLEQRRAALRLLRAAGRGRAPEPAQPVAANVPAPPASEHVPAPLAAANPKPGCAGTREADIDGDGEAELVGTDGNVPANNSHATDLDGDGDKDCVAVGAKDGAKIACIANVDNDPRDQEIVVEDPNVAPANSYGVDLDGDGDHDVVVVGTKR